MKAFRTLTTAQTVKMTILFGNAHGTAKKGDGHFKTNNGNTCLLFNENKSFKRARKNIHPLPHLSPFGSWGQHPRQRNPVLQGNPAKRCRLSGVSWVQPGVSFWLDMSRTTLKESRGHLKWLLFNMKEKRL